MPLVLDDIRTVVIDSIKASIGDTLAQGYNPDKDIDEGIVLTARPNPEQPLTVYPYAVLDIIEISDTEWHLTNLTFDDVEQVWVYETNKTITAQISIFGDDATQIANDLATSYRRHDVRGVLTLGGVALISVNAVTIDPELLQTDFLEVGIIQMSLGVNDCYSDPSLECIEDVVLHGELECTVSGDPLVIDIDTTQN